MFLNLVATYIYRQKKIYILCKHTICVTSIDSCGELPVTSRCTNNELISDQHIANANAP